MTTCVGIRCIYYNSVGGSAQTEWCGASN